MIELTLYGRPGCHLCEEMKAALPALLAGTEYRLAEVEVGWDGALAERYGRLLPVLEYAGAEVCHYFLDADRLHAALGLARPLA